MSLSDADVQTLIEKCFQAKERSYSPYSKFPVGAALLCEDGTIITGTNVENVTYGLTICAERTAFCKAVSEGHSKFKAIAISSNLEKQYIVPCGMCRQTMVEFASEMDVYMTKLDGSYQMSKLSELLPKSFTPSQLSEKRVSDGKDEG